MTTRPPAAMLLRVLAMTSAILGIAAAVHYGREGLALTHYDARGHLIVARRIFDSITPGWQQIGAVWLPLPHLVNALPIQIDALYRSGAFAIGLNVACYVVTVVAIGWTILHLTDATWPAVSGAAVFAFNPNVLYLQSTPMTEPLLLALTVVSVALLLRWRGEPRAHALVGWAFALACLTRYEAWPITAVAFTIALLADWRRSGSPVLAIRGLLPMAIYPMVAGAAFLVFSRVVVGAWFPDDFFVPENPAQGAPYEVVKEIAWGLRELSGRFLMIAAAAGAVVVLVKSLRRDRIETLLPLALIAAAAVPFAAFLDGHPYRIRYMIPLIAAEAICAGIAAGAVRRFATAGGIVLIVLVAVDLRPLSDTAPMVLEAEWDRPNISARAPVSQCLAEGYHGESIMASMGSLGHYMQSLANEGFALRDFLHEGNGDIWLAAIEEPRPYAGWMLIEEKAEGGDMLAKRARENPAFLDGFSRVCEGAGLALYRRTAEAPLQK